MSLKIITHPNNRQILREAIEGENGDKRAGEVACRIQDAGWFGCDVQFNKDMAERDIKEFWHPPKGGRFTEYGPEDEAWMRPLGIGRFEYRDMGPLFMVMDTSFLVRMMMEPMLITPKSMLLNAF